MIADTANWDTNASNIKPVFQNGTVTVTGDNAVMGVAGYTGKAYTNKLFSFTYKQDKAETTTDYWRGFYLQKDPATYSWETEGVLIVLKENQVEVQIYGNEATGMIIVEGTYLKTGQEQDILFGFFDENATDVRIVLHIDGVELFNEVVTDSALVGSQNYLGIITSSDSVSATLGTV